MLSEMCGMAEFTLQPSAGAHGELTGLLIARAYHKYKGNPRKTVILPDSAHGTNPASAMIAGYNVVTVKSDAQRRRGSGGAQSRFEPGHRRLHADQPQHARAL